MSAALYRPNTEPHNPQLADTQRELKWENVLSHFLRKAKEILKTYELFTQTYIASLILFVKC
jgi:hypothetical protein